MRTFYLTAASAVLFVATPAMADSVFDGTWKVDTSTAQMSKKPFVISLAGGTFTCSSCAPSYSVAADGQFHAVTDQPYFDEVSVTEVDPKTVKFAYRQKGKDVETLTDTVSADGKTMQYDDVDMSSPNGQTVTSQGTSTRASAGAKGAHAISGGWLSNKGASISDDALTVSIQTDGDQLTFTQPTGYHYTATFGGPAVPIEGDQANTMATIAKAGPRTMTETDTRDGKVVAKMTITAAADGKTLDIVSENTLQGRTAKFKAFKQ